MTILILIILILMIGIVRYQVVIKQINTRDKLTY